MSYSIKEEVNPNTEKMEYVVLDSSGVKISPPHTFSSKAEALGRIADLKRKDVLEQAERLNAKPPSPGMRCYGKIVGASDTLLIQHLGRNTHALHQRADSDAFAKIEEGDLVSIVDGKIEREELDQSSGLTM